MAIPQHVVAVDQGTTSTRVAVLDPAGRVCGAAQREHAQHFPAPGWVEHDPVEIWEAVRELISLALTRARVGGGDVAAVGITNQRETVVAWDAATGRPVHRAIVWQDTRTADAVAGLVAAGHEPAARERTGLPLTAYFSASKIRWLLDEVPEARELSRARRLRVGTMDAWLVWNLTGGTRGGEHVTDVTNASRTLLMDLDSGSWSAEMLGLFGIDEEEWAAMGPRIRPSIGRLGDVGADEGLAGAPVAGVLGDQQAASFGQALFRPGDTKNTYGTGCFLLQHTGTARPTSEHGLIATAAFQREGGPLHYALEGSVAVAGSLVQWLRDGLGLLSTSAEVEEAAASVPDNGGVVIVPAFSGLYAPHWRPDARGVIAGLTGHATRGHVARAALEATAYQSRDLLEALAADTGRRIQALRVDGGMTVNDALLQFQADILGVPVVRPEVTETTVQGAAWAAGLAVGVWADLDALSSLWREDRRWEPSMEAAERARLLERWSRAVEASLGWA